MENMSDISVAAPTHHPAGEMLIDYATGALSAAEALVIDVHLEFCADCRQAAKTAHGAGGALLDAIEPMALPPAAFQRVLQAIDGQAPSIETVIRSAPTFAVKWPTALREH